MRKFYVQIGSMMTPNGPADMFKVDAAERYEIDTEKRLVFVRGDDPCYCIFNAWNFVYSEDAMPVELARAANH